MSETKVAFVERTIRLLKYKLYCHMEDNGYKHIHKLTQFVTKINSRRVCLIDLIPKNVKNSDFLQLLYSKSLREFRKPKFEIGDRICIWKYDLHSGKVISHSLQKFSKLLQFLPENLQHTH